MLISTLEERMKYTLKVFLIAIVLCVGCASSREYYLRNNQNGCLEGPFINTKGVRILDYTIAFPSKKELGLIQELRNTALPMVVFNDAEIAEVVKALNELQRQIRGKDAVSILLDLKDYLHPDFPEDYSTFLSSGYRGGFGSAGGGEGYEEFDPFEDDEEEREMEYDRAKRTVPQFTCEISGIPLYDLLEIISQSTGLHVDTQDGIVVLRQNKEEDYSNRVPVTD